MKLRPTIFLSGVSSEFGSFRDAVEIEIQKKGCFPLNQPSFAPDYRTVEETLRRRLSEADAVIHIAGFRFGAEPRERPESKQRRSYTQMEFHIAREMQKPIYVFLSANADLRDAPDDDEKSEDADVAAIQSAHRELIRNGDHLYDFFKDKAELCQKVAQIPIVASTDFRVDISRIDKYAPAELIGREEELKLLNAAWLKVGRAESKRPHIITFVALGGEGKTSLVAKWLAELGHNGWPGCDAAFAWSFYSQGTRDQVAASSDLFLKEAITFFGNEDDKKFAASNAGAYEKGQRLGRIVGKRNSLLILDGVEPLQYSPTSPTRSELKDAGLVALLKALASFSVGLCIVTTRYSIPNLKAFWQTTAPELELRRLASNAGVDLLKTLGVRGKAHEFETLVEDAKGHALTLNLLGTYLRDAHGGDIRRRDLVKLEEADAEEQGGHAFRVMEAYERAFEKEGDKGKRAVATLRLLGLFDRPVSADCLAALLEAPAVNGLTESLVDLSEAQRNLVFKRLESAKLVTINRDPSNALVTLDAHPLLREYFARQLRTQQPDTWRAGHRRLYDHLSATTEDKDEPTLEDLQPLYQAVVHGCQAGLQNEVFTLLYVRRILRGKAFYSLSSLGAYGSELAAIAAFFDEPWTQPSPLLSESQKGTLLSTVAFALRAIGRLSEATGPMGASLEVSLAGRDWDNAALRAAYLGMLELRLGNIEKALHDAKQSVDYADRGDAFGKVSVRAGYGDVLHQAGLREHAHRCFSEAEQLQKERQPDYPLLYSMQGFAYTELLLANTEHAAWRQTLEGYALSLSTLTNNTSYAAELRSISERAEYSLNGAKLTNHLLDMALDSLTLGRVALYEALLSEATLEPHPASSSIKTLLTESVDGFRRARYVVALPSGLLTRAWMRSFIGAKIGPESAQEDLDEAWEIAERGPMKLHMADIHLYRARLFFKEEKYPWGSAREDLEAAEKLINECGYHRRDEELADAKRVILGQSA